MEVAIFFFCFLLLNAANETENGDKLVRKRHMGGGTARLGILICGALFGLQVHTDNPCRCLRKWATFLFATPVKLRG